MIFTQWKCPKNHVNAFWYCFKIIKQYSFYFLKTLSISENQSCFQICNCVIHGAIKVSRYYSLVLLYTESKIIQIVFAIDNGTIRFQAERDLTLTKLSAVTFTYLVKFTNMIDWINHFWIISLIFFLHFMYQRPLTWLSHLI